MATPNQIMIEFTNLFPSILDWESGEDEEGFYVFTVFTVHGTFVWDFYGILRMMDSALGFFPPDAFTRKFETLF